MDRGWGIGSNLRRDQETLLPPHAYAHWLSSLSIAFIVLVAAVWIGALRHVLAAHGALAKLIPPLHHVNWDESIATFADEGAFLLINLFHAWIISRRDKTVYSGICLAGQNRR